MRTHGLPNFPNPLKVDGKTYFGFSVDSGVDTRSPVYQKADKYCEAKYLHVDGDPRSPAEKAESNAQAMKYSACMRSHGVSDFPDPSGTGVISVPTSSYLETPKVRSARPQCAALFTGKFVFMVPFP